MRGKKAKRLRKTIDGLLEEQRKYTKINTNDMNNKGTFINVGKRRQYQELKNND